MRVMVLVKATVDSENSTPPDEQLLTDMGNFNDELLKAGILLAGEGLHPSSKGVRVQFSGKRRTVVDGPFAETKELVAGFWLWQVKSMAEAIEWVERCPNPMPGDSEIEIRPVFEAEEIAEWSDNPELLAQELRLARGGSWWCDSGGFPGSPVNRRRPLGAAGGLPVPDPTWKKETAP